MSQDDLVERIRVAAKERKVTQTQLAKLAGMPSQSAMSNVFKGTRKLSREEAGILQDFLGLEREAAFQIVPLIGLASAGAWN